MDTGYPALIADPLTNPNAPKITPHSRCGRKPITTAKFCADRHTSHTHSTQVTDLTPKTFNFPSGTSEKACPEQRGMGCQWRSAPSYGVNYEEEEMPFLISPSLYA